MKRIAIASLVCLGTGGALAQSSVTLYGVFDTGLRYTNHAAAGGGHKSEVAPGLIQGSRWGVRGSEDLGGGISAQFNLESGLNPDTGTSGQQGQIFGRQAWVALGTPYGSLTLGRQFGAAFDTMGSFDPYGIGNQGAISWHLDLTGARFDNTAKYKGVFGPVAVSLAYSAGEQAGSLRKGQTLGLAGGYTGSNFTVNTGVQQSSDINLNKSTVWMIGGTATLGAFKVLGGYVNSKRDKGFIRCADNNATSLAASTPAACGVSASNPYGINSALSNTNLRAGSTLGKASSDLLLLGGAWQATDALQFTLGSLYEKVKVDAANVANAKRATLYAVADYYFSKRTDVYASVDYNRVASGANAGGSVASFNGFNSQTGLMLGMRHRF